MANHVYFNITENEAEVMENLVKIRGKNRNHQLVRRNHRRALYSTRNRRTRRTTFYA